jgi:alcohol dehydrogenase
MWALQHGGAHITTWAEVPMAKIHDKADAVVRVDMTTIRGSNLPILKVDVPEVIVDRVLGHEVVGTVHSVGSGASTQSR